MGAVGVPAAVVSFADAAVMAKWENSGDEGESSGSAFTIRREMPAARPTPAIYRGPSCRACYRPLAEPKRKRDVVPAYCVACEASGGAFRHRLMTARMR